MLRGLFQNCYGIKQFEMPLIDFTQLDREDRRCNKALIYAPNGVMKSSFSKTFEDISNGKPTADRIFRDARTSYDITYYGNRFQYSSDAPDTALTPANCVYVINSFSDKFQFTKDTVGTLLADEATRSQYNTVIEKFDAEVKQILRRLSELTGLTKPKAKQALITDLQLAPNADWPDILEKVRELSPGYTERSFMTDVTYDKLFNDKTMAVYRKPEFIGSIAAYIESLSGLLTTSPLLTTSFTDRSADALSKAFDANDLFGAQHKLQLRDGTVVTSIAQWKSIVNEQMNIIYRDPALSAEFRKLKSMLNANNETAALCRIIVAHQEIIPLLQDIPGLKQQIWLYCFHHLDSSFDSYYANFSQYTGEIRALYEQAEAQSEYWQKVVDQFNRRFRVPFKVKINNKANFLLKDEAPNLSFEYTRGAGNDLQTADLQQDDMMVSLSMGERRALYLMYILFDLERIKHCDHPDGERVLIIADDVADSFDYKNKYAIIEYLDDLAKENDFIDLLILTHNFDFYRSLMSRLGVVRNYCYSVQKKPDGTLTMTVFRYQKDFFKNVIVNRIKSGQINNDTVRKLLIASIPFYRNLCEYSGKEDDYLKLTCFMHWKTAPIDTASARLSDVWPMISCYVGESTFQGDDVGYCETVQRIAASLVAVETDDVNLENKLVISIAARLAAEQFLVRRIRECGQTPVEAESNQTREWYLQAVRFLNDEEKSAIDELNLITPENIHLNSFMFEPLIDISDWALKDLYRRIISL